MSPEPIPLPFPEPLPPPLATASDQPVEVSDLLDHLAHLVDHAGLREVTVSGRLVGWRRTRKWGQGDLITPSADGGDFIARIPIGIPGRTAAAVEARLERSHPGALASDPVVVATGALDVHRRYGPLRLLVRTITLDEDATRRSARARERDLARLTSAGIFARQRSLSLPDRITTIGVLTGGGTAARADFRDRITRLPDDYGLHEFEVPTAGPDAATAIADGLAMLDRRQLDCIVVIRGGGPAVDLSAFDTPTLATAIGQARTPVLTGIGHATDVTLADRAAHRALPTPSAVADHIGRHNAQHAFDTAARSAAAGARALAAQREATAREHVRFRAAAAACVALLVLLLLVLTLG